ncbi:MAG: primosomal protein N', partial [Clostridia bacterium]|nr:primosomal protein N' [Clostridia bacterium]
MTKPIHAVVSSDISFDSKMLSLASFIKAQTLCTMGDAIHAMIPAAALSKLVEYFRPSPNASDSKKAVLSPRELLVLEYVISRQLVSMDSLKNKFGAYAADSVAALISSGLIEKELILKDSDEARTETVYSVAASFLPDADKLINGEKVGDIKLISKKHKDILSALISHIDSGTESPELTSSEISNAIVSDGKSISPQLKALCDKGIIVKGTRKATDSSELEIPNDSPKEITLSEQQENAFRTLVSLADSGLPKAALLFGITGSGKTSVILKTIDHMIESGKGSIILLPEIALTPQSISIFRSRYGNRVAVIHSGLSAGERADTYMKIKRGGADVVLGTRSAIFAPVNNLGLIVIDEEQEHTYKSDMNPKYHARDIARKRCADENALMLLSSATPSLESWKKAADGIYTLIKLTERYGNAVLPTVTVADMRGEARSGNTTPIGTLLAHKLIENKKKDEQSILFINRRGYNNFVSCRSCGTAITCPYCSVA